jgi:hypothetical protein
MDKGDQTMLRSQALAVGLMVGGFMWCPSAPAQDKPSQSSSEVTQQKKSVTKGGTKKTDIDTVIGKVENFEPGKSIKVSVPGTIMTSKTFDLSGNNITAKVASGIKVGDWVQVRETDENNGHKMVSVSRSSEKAANKAHPAK